MSSKKRSKSRSRSRSKPKSEKPDAYGPAEDEVQKGGFGAMLFGMTVSLMLIFWVVSLFNPQKNIKRAELEKRKGIDASTLLLESTSFEQFLREANPDQMMEKLNTIRQSSSPKLSPARVSENNQRIKICEQLLKLDAAPSYKKFAKLQWMDAQKANYGIDFIGRMDSPHVSEEFEKCFTRFLEDTDRDVYEEAHLARVSHVLFECLKGNRKPEEVVKNLNDILDKFPDTERVAATIRLQFRVAIESDINLAKQLAEEVLRNGRLKDERAADLMQYVLDTYQIVDSNYDEMYINRFTNGDVGLRELEKTSLQLINNPEGGVLIVQKVQEVAYWFEWRRMYDSADRIYKAMLDAAGSNRQVAETKDLMQKIGTTGRKRLSLVGKKFSISGTTMAGKEVSDADFKNRVVLVVFFDPKGAQSIKLVNRLARSAKRYAEFGSPIRVVAVPTNAEPFEDKLVERFDKSRIHFMAWVDGQQPEPLEMYPVIDDPQLIAVDHEGKLARLGINHFDYELDVQTLVDQR